MSIRPLIQPGAELRFKIAAVEHAGQEIVIQMTTLTSAEISGAEDVTYYVVQKGDTLWSIARKYYGKRRYWKKIWNANSAITNPNRIYAGQTIILPKL